MDFPRSYFTNGGIRSIHKDRSNGSITTNLFWAGWYNLYRADVVHVLTDYMKGATQAQVESLIKVIEYGYKTGELHGGEIPYVPIQNAAGKYVRASYMAVLTTYNDKYEDIKQTIISDCGSYPDGSVKMQVNPKPASTTPRFIPVYGPTAEEIKAVEEFTKFMSEFNIVPGARLINRCCRAVDINSVKRVIHDYLYLQGHPDMDIIDDKLKSSEVKKFLTVFANCKTEKVINKRLEIYYGPAGHGKSTRAQEKYPDAVSITCSKSMLADDLIRYYDVKESVSNFMDTDFIKAIKNDKPVIFDEANLLDVSVQQTLQPILDNHDEITLVTGEHIKIGPNFKVIMTMNLFVNGEVKPLAEPIVDRASYTEEYILPAKTLAGYAI